MLVPSKNHGLSIRLWKEVCIDMQRQTGRLFGWQERVEQSLGERLRIDPQANADLGAPTKGFKSGV